MVVRHTGILDKGFYKMYTTPQHSDLYLAFTFLQTKITLQVSNSFGGSNSKGLYVYFWNCKLFVAGN